jgi:streptogramin lyase/DNA-binding CsgD family transcriptional regulator
MPWLAALVVGQLALFGQTPDLERFGLSQGISQGFVTCIIQDREGFIWAGTPNGLNRFDGYRYLAFTHDPFDAFSISGDFVTAVFEKGDYLLVGTYNSGLNIFHKKTQRFFRVPHLAAAQSPTPSKVVVETQIYPAENVVNNIVQDAKGDIWMKASNTVHDYQGWAVRMRVPPGFWDKLPENPALLNQLKFEAWWFDKWELYPIWPNKIVAHGDGLYCFQLSGLLAFDFEKKQWLPAQQFKGVPGLISNIVWPSAGAGCLLQSPDLQSYYCAKPGTCMPMGKMPGQVMALDDKLVWVREGPHIAAYNFDIPFKGAEQQPVIQLPLLDERTVAHFDRSGNLWFTEGTNGLWKYSPKIGRFQHFFRGKSIMTKPFMSKSGGIYQFRTPLNLEFGGTPDPVLKMILDIWEKDSLLSFNLNDDGNGHYWMAAYQAENKDVFLVKIDTKRLSYSTFKVPGLKGVSMCAEFDAKGKLWFPVQGTLVSFDPKAPGEQDNPEKWRFYEFGAVDEADAPVVDLEMTPDGSWWMATYAGLIRAKPNGNGFVFSIYKNNPADRNSLHSSFILSLLADPKNPNQLWVGTKGGGLGCLDINSGFVKTLHAKNGLPDNVIYGVLSDHNMIPSGKDYSLWLSTNRGIVRYTPATGTIKNFRKADGLQEDEFNTHAFAYSDNFLKGGKLMFGGVNGLNVFHPNDLVDNPHKPRVLITGLRVNNKPITARDSASILPLSIEFTRQITLPYAMNSVAFDFAALEFTAPSKNRYRYWLEGLEKEENAHISEQPNANYIGLPPGNYTFTVYGSNNDGVWGEEPARLQIRVLPPWYRTGWAYSFYAMVLAGLLFWAFRHYRLEKNATEARHQLEINRIKLEEFAKLLLEKSRQLEELQTREQPLQISRAPLAEEHRQFGFPDGLEEEKNPGEREENGWQGGGSQGEIDVDELQNLQILTKEDWSNFQVMFEKAFPGYLQELQERLPKLTAAETRLFLLNKIGLGKKELASVLGISPETVKKTGQRLRKKLVQLGYSMDDLFQD